MVVLDGCPARREVREGVVLGWREREGEGRCSGEDGEERREVIRGCTREGCTQREGGREGG